MNNLEKGKVSKEGSTSKDKIKRDQEIVYNISYKTPNESNNSNTSTDDSCQNSQTCSEENDSANFSNENISKNVEEKKIDMVQNIIDYNKSLKLGIPYNIINAIPKGTNNVNTNLFKVINKFEKNSHASPYLQKNVLLKYMINKDIGKGNYKQNTTNFANYLFKNEKKKEPYAFSTMTKKMPIFFKPINKSDILKKASFNSPNSDNTILRKNIRNELSNHINSPNKNEKKKDKNEKSKIINNLLLNKLFINKQINMEKERNFKNTFTRLLKNKNFIKHKIQNSLYELKEIQYGGYTSNESSDTDVSSLFRINNFVNKKSRDNVSTSSDFNLPKNVSEKENNFSDSIKNKKYMSNEVLSLNKVSQNKLKKKLIEESDYVFSFVHTEDGSSDESLSYLKKEKQRMERLRSISYKNRLTKLSILKKNIQQFKENAKNVSKSESVHNNFDHLKHKTNEKKTKNNIPSKSDHNNNEKNEIENDTDGESEKVEVKSKVRSLSKHKTNEKEKDILTDSPNDESEKSKEIKEDEKIELKKNSNNNKLRVKANLKSITSKDEGGKKTEACLRSTSHEKGKIQNSIDKEKINTTNYTDTEMEIKKKNSRELSLKTYNGAYLKKRAGSGGGNYLKIKSVSLTNAKNVEKNETRGVDENDKHDNICQLTSLERIDPNKWVQRIFGDT